MTLEVGPIKSS